MTASSAAAPASGSKPACNVPDVTARSDVSNSASGAEVVPVGIDEVSEDDAEMTDAR